MEIERKFIVTNKEKIEELIKEHESSKKSIVQDYIYSDIYTSIRKRMIVKNGEYKYYYTVKTGRNGFSVNEFEEEIPKEKYDLLKTCSDRITIEKDRYFIPYIDGLVIELDIFHGKYEGVVFAEIEYNSEEQAISTKVPEWFGEEIGNEISNDKMSLGIFPSRLR